MRMQINHNVIKYRNYCQKVKVMQQTALSVNRNEDEIYSINQASDFLKAGKGQIYQWVNNSKMVLAIFHI
jgi:hypothetical protein